MHQYGPQNDWSRMKRGAPEEIGVKSSPSSSNSAPERRQNANISAHTTRISTVSLGINERSRSTIPGHAMKV